MLYPLVPKPEAILLVTVVIKTVIDAKRKQKE